MGRATFTLFFYPILAIFLCLGTCTIQASSESLSKNDIDKVMQQILDQHLDSKGMTSEIMKNGVKVYLNQFDPHRIYLLENEVAPFLEIPDWQMNRIMRDYKNNDFSIFNEINKVIEKGIARSREARSKLLFQKLYQLSEKTQDYQHSWEDPDLTKAFAKTQEEMTEGIALHWATLLNEEKIRYGAQEIQDYQTDILKIFEEEMRHHEKFYLFQDETGQPYSQSKRESIFVMNVLKALATSLDSHTHFFNQNEAFDMKIRLEKGFYGTGVVPIRTTQGIFVDRLLEGSPAAKSGQIGLGDSIVEVDGQSVSFAPFSLLQEKILGDKGQVVSLLVRNRENNLVNLKIESDLIVIQEDRADVGWDPFEDGIIGKITLHGFYKGEGGISSENDVKNAIELLQKQGPLRGLVLDLRENSGGFLLQAVKVAGLFMTNGVVVISKYTNGEEHMYRDMDGKSYYEGPLIVLTSKATASAAEIVAQALQDYGIALVVGDEHTYGKGTIQSQTVTDNEGTSFFKVTVGKYYTVSGQTPQKRGVLANIVVPSQYAYDHIGEEYLESSVEYDTVDPHFEDSLKDITPSVRGWYAKYYTPQLQKRNWKWQKMLPLLIVNSHTRVSNNKKYSQFVKKMTPLSFQEGEDLQMDEAENILRDMIHLDPRLQ